MEDTANLSIEQQPRPLPLCLTVEEAAHYAGIGTNNMLTYIDSEYPPPMLMVGSRRYIQRDGLVKYLEEKQTWHY